VIPLLGFTPDVDPMTPGAIVDCSQVVPYESGMKTAPAPVSVGLAALAADARGAVVTRDLSNAKRFFVGTAAKLYDAGATTYTDVSRGASYSLGTDDRWSFVQFGNTTLAVNLSCVLQKSTGAAFSDLTAPKALVVEQSQGFVMLFNTIEGTYGTSPDRWWCSATFDETNWVPAVSTQCTTGRLVGGSGPITAGKRFGDDIIAYKNRSMFVGRYQGPPVVWQFTQVSYEVGCVGPEAVTDTPIGHVFVGEDDIYLYDGTVPRSLTEGVCKQWFANNVSPAYRYRCKLLWDRSNALVWVFFPSANATECDSALVYNIVKKQWGLAAQAVQAVVNYTTPAFTYDGGSPLITTYDSGPAISFDSPFWVSGSAVPAYIGTTRLVYSLTGIAPTSSFTTGDFGDDKGQTECTQYRVRFIQAPDTASVMGTYKYEEGTQVMTAGPTQAKTDGKFDIRQTGRFHRFKCDMTGAAKFTAVRPKLMPAGTR